MISIYSSAFNLLINNFNYKFALDNFCNIADEVVVCVNTSDDETLSSLQIEQKTYPNLKIITSNISYDNPQLDGQIKNTALQATSINNPIKIGLDMDEYIPLSQKYLWQDLAFNLLHDDCLSYMVPSINLYRDKNHYFSITPKWYIHKTGLLRGPVNFAKKLDGFIDTQKSDGCELIDSFGNLVSSKITPYDIESLRSGGLPFVVHMGYLSLEDRVKRNINFWDKHWLLESGGYSPPHKVHKNLKEFTEEYFPHHLQID
jgi:hypothetical protein